MRGGARAISVCTVLLLAPVVLSGQGQSVELGIDGSLKRSLKDPTTTRASIPVESFRFGWFPNNTFSIEPSIALTHIDGQNSDAFLSVSFRLSALFHVTANRGGTQPFFRPTTGVKYYLFGSDGISQLVAGGFLGLKTPVADHLSVRLEAGYERGFESDDLAPSDEVALNLGISLFVQ